MLAEAVRAAGALKKVLHGLQYGFDLPAAVSSDGTNVWVTNADQSVTGFPAA
jgi:hypothetical protein